MTVVGEAFVEVRPLLSSRFDADLRAQLAAESEFGSGGLGIASGVRKDMDEADRELTTRGRSLQQKAAGLFSAAGSGLGAVGLPGASGFSKAGEKIGAAETRTKALGSALVQVGKVATIASLAVGGAMVYEAARIGEANQAATAAIASQEQISLGAAGKINQAFLETGGTAIDSATALDTAFAAYGAQLATVQGRALSTRQAVAEMTTAMDLQEASGEDLTSATAALAGVQQAYRISAEQSGHAADVLFTTSQRTGTSVTQVAQGLERLKGRLGLVAPSLTDTAGLMVSLAENGITGSRGLQLVSSGTATLLSGTTAVSKALAELNPKVGPQLTALQNELAGVDEQLKNVGQPGAADALKQRILDLRQQIADIGTPAKGDEAAKAQVKALRAEESQLQIQLSQTSLNVSEQKQALTAHKNAVEEEIAALEKQGLSLFNAKGQFIGMTAAIARLRPAFAAMTEEQQIATAKTLFGAGAGEVFLKVIREGPQAFEANARAVGKVGAAHEAARKQAETLRREEEVLGVDLEDLGARAGRYLIPKIQDVAHWLAVSLNWLDHNKVAAEALGGVVGGALTVAIGAFTVNKLARMASGLGEAVRSVGKMATALSRFDDSGVLSRVGQKLSGVGSSGQDAAKGIRATGDAAGSSVGPTARAAGAQDALAASERGAGDAAAAEAGEQEGLAAKEGLAGDAAGTAALEQRGLAGAEGAAGTAGLFGTGTGAGLAFRGAAGAEGAAAAEEGGSAFFGLGAEGAAGTLTGAASLGGSVIPGAVALLVGYQIGSAINARLNLSGKLAGALSSGTRSRIQHNVGVNDLLDQAEAAERAGQTGLAAQLLQQYVAGIQGEATTTLTGGGRFGRTGPGIFRTLTAGEKLAVQVQDEEIRKLQALTTSEDRARAEIDRATSALGNYRYREAAAVSAAAEAAEAFARLVAAANQRLTAQAAGGRAAEAGQAAARSVAARTRASAAEVLAHIDAQVGYRG